MRTIHTDEIIRNVKEMCIEANLHLSEDMEQAIRTAKENEKGTLGKQILGQLCENMDIAANEQIPICQDTGMAVFFVKVGQDLHIEGMNITDAINEGVRQGYTEGYLRKSVVADPLLRENTKDNTPAIIHYDIVPGDSLEILIAPKGFGSENMSRVFMLKPADGAEGVKNAVIEAVKDAGPNACPPIVVGVGIGDSCKKSTYQKYNRGLFFTTYPADGTGITANDQSVRNRTGRSWRFHNCTCSQYRNLPNTYCRSSGCSEHVLSCEPACEESTLGKDNSLMVIKVWYQYG